MSMRKISQARRAAAAVTVAAALTFTLGACGGDDSNSDDASSSKPAASQEDQGKDQEQQGSASQEPETVLTTLRGPKEITLDLTSVVRDSGGFVTVKGVLKNSGEETFVQTTVWSGPELEIIKGAGGSSLGGATLVDKAEKKRYYILRDTDNRPLATTGIPTIKPGATVPVYMQFPAPPDSTTEVDFQLPTFASTTLKFA
ncbi:hypothetical protein ACFVWX_27660 [Streptomyces sp. NPDC058220]|uniref:hypothetical protein n=1 Tax=unclassified Streptomyces TaxID=2593676 RepID=UPI0036E3164A